MSSPRFSSRAGGTRLGWYGHHSSKPLCADNACSIDFEECGHSFCRRLWNGFNHTVLLSVVRYHPLLERPHHQPTNSIVERRTHGVDAMIGSDHLGLVPPKSAPRAPYAAEVDLVVVLFPGKNKEVVPERGRYPCRAPLVSVDLEVSIFFVRRRFSRTCGFGTTPYDAGTPKRHPQSTSRSSRKSQTHRRPPRRSDVRFCPTSSASDACSSHQFVVRHYVCTRPNRARAVLPPPTPSITADSAGSSGTGTEWVWSSRPSSTTTSSAKLGTMPRVPWSRRGTTWKPRPRASGFPTEKRWIYTGAARQTRNLSAGLMKQRFVQRQQKHRLEFWATICWNMMPCATQP